ncbi:unnamed protein product [Moneuplotes crassus]|uniref:Uncharacterized protein n=1 Tax=Euplotes crassus TaxID=5936 RepID=A0AAD1XS04_EUPCR|nr:unnamed protein product [Moneuplotes crassus]
MEVGRNVHETRTMEEAIISERHTLKKERAIEKSISLNLLEKHEMKYPMQFNRLCLNIAFDRNIDQNYAKEITKIGRIGLRNLAEVIFNYIQSKKSKVTKSLLLSIPNRVNKVLFDNFSLQRYKIFRYYAPNFTKVLPSVTRIVSLVGCEITSSHFKSLLAACNAQELRFIKCRIYASSLKLNINRPSKIKILTFIECGKQKYSNWKHYPEAFECIMKSTSSCAILDSLEKVELLDNSIAMANLNTIITNYYQGTRPNTKKVNFEVFDDELKIFREFRYSNNIN